MILTLSVSVFFGCVVSVVVHGVTIYNLPAAISL